MNTPLISVVIPLYNKENSVSRALTSVLSQSYKNFELIVIDDGSTDTSAEKAREFDDPRLKIVSQTNRGVSAARNVGVKLATADYVAFLDADDSYSPNFLKHISQLIVRNQQAALFSCRLQFVDENNQLFRLKALFGDNFKGELTCFFSTFAKDRAIIHPSSMAVNKAKFLDLGGFPEGKHVGEDLQLILSLALSGQVMHDSYCGATAFRNAENRTITRKPQELSCHIVYFLTETTWKNQVDKYKIQAVQQFCIHNAVLHAAGAALNRQRELSLKYGRLVWPHSKIHAMLIVLLALTPTPVLQWLKSRRNTPN
uniref:Beta-1,3-glucosyltransferase n=1 Tax=Rheinheimera sp. BAL341 TaxID=1708203 RepID=A0A486XVK5_9GAMM